MGKKNIILVGFMGTGKSTVGWRLAQRLHMDFIDMDKEIERITGLTVSDFFRRHGEVRFRSEERVLAAKLAQKENMVIATGGGVVLQQENIQALGSSGIIIRLEASPEEILNRVNRKKGTRPLLNRTMNAEDISAILDKREPLYACARYRVYTSGKDVEEVVNEIMDILKQEDR
ncbi:MAG: shikimate kinase [Syntrophomonadaceae bacterium]|nr:shikimate kinase [Syntrophomonadaceae bacterium]